MAPLTIVFDLDGTLIDTAPDLIDTLNLVLAREGLLPVPYDTARTMIGSGARAMIARGLEAAGQKLTDDRLEHLLADFIAHYSEHLADRSRPFPGLIDALDELMASDFRLAVCTNKFEHFSLHLLQKLKLASRFAAICGQDTFGMQKPDPEILLRTINAAGGDPQHAIMVGDTKTDIEVARATGIPIIAVDFGYSEKPIAEFSPDCVISSFMQLPQSVANIQVSNFKNFTFMVNVRLK